MNEKMNGGISTMQGIFCRLPFQKGGITAETIAAQGFDSGIFSVDTQHTKQGQEIKPLVPVLLYLTRKYQTAVCRFRLLSVQPLRHSCP